jgi:hypothetical protein
VVKLQGCRAVDVDLGSADFVGLLVSHHMVVRYSEGLLKYAIGGILA